MAGHMFEQSCFMIPSTTQHGLVTSGKCSSSSVGFFVRKQQVNLKWATKHLQPTPFVFKEPNKAFLPADCSHEIISISYLKYFSLTLTLVKVLCAKNLPKLVRSINQFVYLINEFYPINWWRRHFHLPGTTIKETLSMNEIPPRGN